MYIYYYALQMVELRGLVVNVNRARFPRRNTALPIAPPDAVGHLETRAGRAETHPQFLDDNAVASAAGEICVPSALWPAAFGAALAACCTNGVRGMPGRHLRAVQLRGSRHALCTRCHPHRRDRRHRLGSLAAGPRTRRVDAGALRWVCVCGLHDGSLTSMAHERIASSSACYGLPVVLRRPVCCALDGRSEAACAKHGHFFNQTLYNTNYYIRRS